MTPYEELTERWPKVLQSTLWRAGGFLALRGFPGKNALAAIRRESEGILRKAERQEWSNANQEDWRGGQPERFVSGVTAGHCLNGICGGPEMLRVLQGLLSAEVRYAGGGSITVYDRPGDRLGLHRDIEVCDVTLVTCLWEDGERQGALRAYPEYCALPLSMIPASRANLGFTVDLQAGDSAVLLGGVVPHEVTPMGQGQRRVVSLVCYQLMDSSA